MWMIPLTVWRQCRTEFIEPKLDSLWGKAGTQAREWISNSPEIVAATLEADRATELQISEGQEPVVKTLGIS